MLCLFILLTTTLCLIKTERNELSDSEVRKRGFFVDLGKVSELSPIGTAPNFYKIVERTNMHAKHLHTPETDQTKWYRSPVLMAILLLTFLMVWFVLSARAIRELEIQPTHLTLRSDSCGFLKIKGITTTPIEPGNWCSVVVPFRGNVISGGGVIKLGDRQIRVADDQVIEVGPIVDQTWTAEQTRSAIWAGISTLLVLAIMVWMWIV